MIPDNQTLDEVVVVGYGTMKRSDLTGSVASIAAKDVEGFKTSSVAGALGGQIAGVQITSTDGTQALASASIFVVSAIDRRFFSTLYCRWF